MQEQGPREQKGVEIQNTSGGFGLREEHEAFLISNRREGGACRYPHRQAIVEAKQFFSNCLHLSMKFNGGGRRVRVI